MKVLFIEDELYVALPAIEILKQNKYSVDLAVDGEEGLHLGLTGVYDIILLDIMLPKINGIEILKQLRKSGIKTPILMLTARNQVEDQVKGLDFGADDYLSKPYQYPILLARLRALSRRSPSFAEDNTLKFVDLEFRPHDLMLSSKIGTQKLTLKEAQLIELLMQRGKMITPKQLIIEKLWQFESDAGVNNVEYHISALRKKIKKLNAMVSIKTVWGVGYQLNHDEKA